MTEIPPPANVDTRRRFLNKLWIVLGLASVAEFLYLIVSFLGSRKQPSQQRGMENIVVVGPIDKFKPETVTAVPQGQFYLARLAGGSVLALSRTCTHLGCSLPWDTERNQFVCPCHGSTFNLKGEVLSAPALRPLDYYPVRIENGTVKVDISAPTKREKFEPSQAATV